MATLLTADQLGKLIDLQYEIMGLGRPNQTRYSEDVCRRMAEILAPATGVDVQTAINHARDNPWTMWVALITALDNEALGYIFQTYANWYDWEVVILQALVTQTPEKPGVPPEWIVRRLARILNDEWFFFERAITGMYGMSTEQALAEQPLAVMLLAIEYIDFFYVFP